MKLLFPSALAAVLALTLPLHAEPPAAGHGQVPDSYSFPLGRVQISALSDGTVPQDLHELMHQTPSDHIDALLAQDFLQNPVEASINAYLIRDGNRLILVDTGSGDLFGPGFGGKLEDSLAAIGIMPGDITDILITHIHTDHSGGLIEDGAPRFENATVHVSAADAEFFFDDENAARSGYDLKYFEEAIQTVAPYRDLGKLRTFEDGEQILPGISASLHPGHTPGTAFFTLRSEEEAIVFVGDILHVAAVQFPDPEVTIIYDVDPAAAASARKQAFSAFAEDRALLAAPHLPFPGIGHISEVKEDSYRWHPMEYRNRAGD